MWWLKIKKRVRMRRIASIKTSKALNDTILMATLLRRRMKTTTMMTMTCLLVWSMSLSLKTSSSRAC